MAHGNDGEVYVGSNQVAKVVDFSYEEEVSLTPKHVKGDTNDSFEPGRKNGSGTITCLWDPTDTDGQQAMQTGSSVTLSLYEAGKATGQNELSGTVIIQRRGRNSPDSDMCKATFSFNGVLDEGQVP